MTQEALRHGSANCAPLLNNLAASRFLWTDELARPEQVPPDDHSWAIALFLSGRGWGKTRVGAEWTAWQSVRYPKTRWAVVAATFSDVRDTCAEGESGLVPILRRYNVLESYNRSIGEIRLVNGSRIKLFSAAEPDRLRGPQFHGSWCDEIAAWVYPDTWDQLQFGLRLGTHPQSVVTTTPRPVPVVKRLLERHDGSVIVTRGSTFDNAANLAPSALAELRARYEGTRLGRQELYAELLEDTPSALWTYEMIERNRANAHPDLSRVVVAIDPATTSNEDSDWTGIVAVGKGVDGRGYTLADRSCKLPPMEWAQRALNLYDEVQADTFVIETNQGGDAWEAILRQLRPGVAVKGVTAKRGKVLRAQPVSALWEQDRCSNVGGFPELEEQMLGFTGDPAQGSPDRLDAYVHAITALDIGASGAADRILLAAGGKCPSCNQFNMPDSAVCAYCRSPLVAA